MNLTVYIIFWWPLNNSLQLNYLTMHLEQVWMWLSILRYWIKFSWIKINLPGSEMYFVTEHLLWNFVAL